jgi:membrane-anchored glycerophosphoryl diester phosphodiesterase (GDPDase)
MYSSWSTTLFTSTARHSSITLLALLFLLIAFLHVGFNCPHLQMLRLLQPQTFTSLPPFTVDK